MPSMAEQIVMRAPEVMDEAPDLNVMPLSATSILQSAKQTQIDNEDPWEVAKQVSQVVSDPEKMQAILENVASDFDDHAPNAAMDARLATARMLNFLASKAPKASFAAPGMPEVKPTRSELNKFERYMKAVKDPTGILDDALAGTLTPEGLDTVRTVYPGLYAKMQSDLADRINNAEKIPYNRKIQLSALLGQDMSGTLNPRLGLMAQQTYMSANEPQLQRGQQMPVSRAQGLGTAGRAGAETQAWREAQDRGLVARVRGQGRR
jgi:hypothetical protein